MPQKRMTKEQFDDLPEGKQEEPRTPYKFHLGGQWLYFDPFAQESHDIVIEAAPAPPKPPSRDFNEFASAIADLQRRMTAMEVELGVGVKKPDTKAKAA